MCQNQKEHLMKRRYCAGKFPFELISIIKLVPTVGLEPTRVSPPPPQDGVSASFTTSAYITFFVTTYPLPKGEGLHTKVGSYHFSFKVAPVAAADTLAALPVVAVVALAANLVARLDYFPLAAYIVAAEAATCLAAA